MQIEKATNYALKHSTAVEKLELAMLEMPQVACPVVHHFGPGVYMREVSIPAGTLAIGHAQKHEHINIMLKGRVVMLNDDATQRELVAPITFVGKPGRKVGYVLEDMVWLNVYATEERDIEALEAFYIDKSAMWEISAAQRHASERIMREADRADYVVMLAQSGFTHEIAKFQSENEADQVPMPAGYAVRILPSPIDGLGVFVSYPVEVGQVIAPARLEGKRTPAGRFTNHAVTPNAIMVLRDSGDIDMVALRRIEGCVGGLPGEEVTIDYRQALAVAGVRCIEKETA